jgi:hypothetical protein
MEFRERVIDMPNLENLRTEMADFAKIATKLPRKEREMVYCVALGVMLASEQQPAASLEEPVSAITA